MTSTTGPRPDQGPIHRVDRGGGSLRELSAEECWERLSECSVGRIAYVDPHGPVVVPLNYQVVDGRIWIRTSSYDQLAVHLPHQHAAFEVDRIDEHSHTGWSVLVRGRAEHVLRGRDAPSAVWPDPEPWPEGVRRMTFCLTPSAVTGRSLQQRDVTPVPGHGPGTIHRHVPDATGPSRG